MKTTFIILTLVLASGSFAQWNVDRSKRHAPPSDTNIIFSSPYPLIASNDTESFRNALGFDLLFSTFGFGVGGFYRYQYTEQIYGFVHLTVTGAKDGTELEQYDYYTGTTFVPGKVNRFFLFPLMVGLQYRLLKDVIVDNFRPFVSAGVGPTTVLATPANDEFFHSFGNARTQFTPSGFIGIGANFGGERKNIAGVSLKYYIIPYNGGLESIEGRRIKNFNSIFLGLTMGFAY